LHSSANGLNIFNQKQTSHKTEREFIIMSISSQHTNVETIQYNEYALSLYQAGFNVVPMRSDSKAPNLTTWKEYCTERQTEQAVRSFHWAQNIGIINGINSIRTLDLDGCTNAEVLFKLLELMGIEPGYQWVVSTPGKGGGFHIYIQCPHELTLTTNGVLVGDPIQKDDFKQLELRWSNCLSMFPHSIHPETHTAYEWAFGQPETPIAIVPLPVVQKAFLALATIQNQSTKPSSIKKGVNPQAPKATEKPAVPRFDVWAQKAFDQELHILRHASEGQRNHQLNKSAFSLGQIIGSKLLDEDTVIKELERTATTIGLQSQEIKDTIQSGIEAGRKKPRMPKQIFKANEPALTLPPAEKVEDEKLASFSADDQGHAEAVFHLYGKYMAYNEAYGWLIWNGTHFASSIQRINTLIVEVLRRRQRAAAHLERTDLAKVSRSMAGTVSATRSMLENLAYVPVEEFDNEPDLFNSHNGIVHLRTKVLVPHDPVYRFTWCSPVNYNPNADRTQWLDFLKSTLASPIMIKYLQEALGYSITGLTFEEVLFYIYGPPRSGKGTTTETVMAVIPRPIAIEVDFNSFTAKREGDSQNFDLAPLKGARVVFASESNKFQSLNPAKVKSLTGGNEVYCSYKHKDMFTYKPQYAVWLSSNHEVNADADDDALWGRVRVISFPNSRLGQEDKRLKQQLQSPENLEAVLAWMIDGASMWYQREGKGLETPQEVKDLTTKQRSGQDSVGLWIEECCEIKEGEWVANTIVRISYENWCEANGYEPKKAKGFAQSLEAHGLDTSVQKNTYNPSGVRTKTRGVQGITIN
jgi:putative DNA primase/helicase